MAEAFLKEHNSLYSILKYSYILTTLGLCCYPFKPLLLNYALAKPLLCEATVVVIKGQALLPGAGVCESEVICSNHARQPDSM